MTDTITRLRTSNTAKCVLALAAAAVLLAVLRRLRPAAVSSFRW